MQNLKTKPAITTERVSRDRLARFSPIRSLTPETLSRQLDEFQAGNFRRIGPTWEAIERRDDVIRGVASKRKKAVARLNWEVLTVDDSPEAQEQRKALEFFYGQLTATSAVDQNQRGGFALLVEQMMDAVGKKYSMHEIVWEPVQNNRLTATFRFAPLWFFENRVGWLKFLASGNVMEGEDLQEGAWLVTVGEGLMEACSVAYMYKNLPLRDWLIYSERNGMPGVKGVTDALPGTPEWNQAKEAVEEFGSEFHALMNRGTEIEAIDLRGRGDLPYPQLVERMDKAIIALWRGADLSTLSASSGGVGASVQKSETALLEHHDALMVSETLNAQVDRVILRHLFGAEHGKAFVKIKTTSPQDIMQDLKIFRELWEMGAPVPLDHLFDRFGIPIPIEGEKILQKSEGIQE